MSDSNKPWWRRIGPGFITGMADDDPSGIGTYSIAGAQYGTGLLWMVLFLIPGMVVVQEMCGRLASVTGRGIAAVLSRNYPRGLMWSCLGLLAIANVFNMWADFAAMAASLQMLLGGSLTFWVLLSGLATAALMVLVPYRVYVQYLKWLCVAFLAYVVTAVLPAVRVHWGDMFSALIHVHWQNDTGYVMTMVGFLGTTISPYLFFWQAGETVEEEILEGKIEHPGQPRKDAPSDAEIRRMRGDTAIGMVASNTIAFFVMVCAASVLHGSGQTHVQTATDAARALLPLGHAAYILFTAGIVGSAMLAIPTLAGSAAYGIAEALGWPFGLYRRFSHARRFYLTLVALVLGGMLLNFLHTVPPMQALLYSAVLNGVTAPPLIAVLLLMCNNPKIMKGRRNGFWSNLLGGVTGVAMLVAAVAMLWGLRSGN